MSLIKVEARTRGQREVDLPLGVVFEKTGSCSPFSQTGKSSVLPSRLVSCSEERRRAEPLWYPGWPQGNARMVPEGSGEEPSWQGQKLASLPHLVFESHPETRLQPFPALQLTSRSCPAHGFPSVSFIPHGLGGSRLSSVTRWPDTPQPRKRDGGQPFSVQALSLHVLPLHSLSSELDEIVKANK